MRKSIYLYIYFNLFFANFFIFTPSKFYQLFYKLLYSLFVGVFIFYFCNPLPSSALFSHFQRNSLFVSFIFHWLHSCDILGTSILLLFNSIFSSNLQSINYLYILYSIKNLNLTQFFTFLSPNHFKVQLNLTENQSFKCSFADSSFSVQN